MDVFVVGSMSSRKIRKIACAYGVMCEFLVWAYVAAPARINTQTSHADQNGPTTKTCGNYKNGETKRLIR